MAALGFPLGQPLGGSGLVPGAGVQPTVSSVHLVSGLVATPQDFGGDILVFSDLDESMTPVFDGRVLGEAIAKRFLTQRGTLPFHEDSYGRDIRDDLNEAMTTERLFSIKAELEAEARADERVLDASIKLSFDAARGEMTIDVELQTEQGPYSLTILVSQLTVQLLQG